MTSRVRPGLPSAYWRALNSAMRPTEEEGWKGRHPTHTRTLMPDGTVRWAPHGTTTETTMDLPTATLLTFKRGHRDADTQFVADSWDLAAKVARKRGHERLAGQCEARAPLGMPQVGELYLAGQWICVAS